MNIYDDLKYPIKYALLPIEDQVGWQSGLYELERYYDICGYNVSKVYLVGKKEEYRSDGTKEISYQVVFPYDTLDAQKQNFSSECIRKYPVYNLNWKQYNNFIEVSMVYDDFAKAKENANILNQLLRRKYSNPINSNSKDWKKVIEEKNAEFDKRLERYLLFEEFILSETKDMVITKEKSKTLIKKPSDS